MFLLQCQLYYSDKIDNVTVMFSDGTRLEAPVMSDALPLCVILTLGQLQNIANNLCSDIITLDIP